MRRMSLILAGLALATWPGAVAAQTKTDKPALVLDSGGHTAPVTGVLFTPDDRQVITVSRDKTVRIWDVSSGEPVRVLRLPVGPDTEGELHCAALSPGGRFLAVAGHGVKGREGAIYVIDLASGRIQRVLKGHIGAVHALAFSPDGAWLASGGRDASVRLWDTVVKWRERVLLGHKGDVVGLAFAPDGKRLVSLGGAGLARLWTVDANKPLRVFGATPGRGGVAWSPDGKTIAIAYVDGIRLWNEKGTSSKLIAVKHPHALSFSADSRSLLMAGLRCAFLNLDGTERSTFGGHTHKFPSLFTGALSHDGRRAITAWQSDDVCLWRTDKGTLVHRLIGRGQTNRSIGWSADGQTVAWGTELKQQSLPHALSLAELEIISPGKSPYYQDRQTLNTLSLTFRFLNKKPSVMEGKVVVSNLKLTIAARCATLVPSPRTGINPRVAFGGSGLELYDARTGALLRKFKGAHGISAIAPSQDGRYLLTASENQALTVWDVDRADEALLSLFVAGREWIAWTPEGYYACSPGGEQLMGWHVNNGPDQLATVHPAARFRNSLYRPDVIKLLLREGSVARALVVADKEVGKPSQRVEVAEVLPPTVLVTMTTPNPKKPQEVKVEAVAQATAKHPVIALRLFLDGRPFGGKKALKKVAKPGPGQVRETWQLALPPGARQLAVHAESTVSKGFSEAVDIVASRGLKPVPGTPEKLKKDLPRLHVLAIGISDYPDKLRLRFATKDASVLAKTFASTGKALFREVKVEVLTDKKADRATILDRLEKLPDQVATGDVLVVTFAGHGGRDATGKFYLLPVDANPKKLLSTCVDGDQVKNVLASLPCKVILVLDACHSGAVGGVVSNLVRDLVTEDRGVIVMCAAMGKEVALESEKVGHGFFTKALVDGLSGKAASKDGKVYLHQLDAYIYDQVKEWSADQQHPAITRPTSVPSFALAQPK